MTAFSDFAVHGYEVIKELGHNLEGGRFTYLAERLDDNAHVVIKYFLFPRKADQFSVWDKDYKNEIAMLSDLKNPRIPKLLENFELTDGSRGLVLEYKSGKTLAVRRSYSPDEIKTIITQILETLVYCQEEKIPDIIHKDIKPSNILVDLSANPLQVSVVDFGIARRGRVELGVTTMVQGTEGYIAPEQRLRKALGKSADLYGLGATIIYLLRSDLQQPEQITELIDTRNTIHFQNKEVSEFSLPFLKWLDRLVQPEPEERFASAKDALKALMPLYVKRVPEVKFFKDGAEFDPSKDVLEFKAIKLGEKLVQTITIFNPIPETFLEGHWEVAPHPNDPPHTPDNHAWISFDPTELRSNETVCNITVNTKKLSSNSQFIRQINCVCKNSSSQDNLVSIQVTTSKLVEFKHQFSYLSLLAIMGISALVSWLVIQTLVFATACVLLSINPPSMLIWPSNISFTSGMVLGPLLILIVILQAFFLLLGAFGFHIFSLSGTYPTLLMSFIGQILVMIAGASCTWGLVIWPPIIAQIFKGISTFISEVQEDGSFVNLINTVAFLTGITFSVYHIFNYFDPLNARQYLISFPINQIFYIVTGILIITIIYPYFKYYQETNHIRQKEKMGGLIKSDR